MSIQTNPIMMPDAAPFSPQPILTMRALEAESEPLAAAELPERVALPDEPLAFPLPVADAAGAPVEAPAVALEVPNNEMASL